MKILWAQTAWDDYVSFQSTDKKAIKRINSLIKDIDRGGYEGIGKPEPLKYELTGWWSRRIDSENRIVYRVVTDKTGFKTIEIAACKGHYAN